MKKALDTLTVSVYNAYVRYEQYIQNQQARLEMLLNLTDRSAEPLHRQISIQLAKRILDGDLEAGMQLPSLTAMARGQHVSRSTVELAYTTLAHEGLVRLRSRRGPVVSDLLPEDRLAAAARIGASSLAVLDAIEAFSGRLVALIDRRKMGAVLLESLKRYVRPQTMLIAWPEEKEARWCMLTESGEARSISVNNAEGLIEKLRVAEGPIRISHDADSPRYGELLEALLRWDSDLVFPLRQGHDLLGLVALGVGDGGRALPDESLNIASIFVNQFTTALAMANMYVGSIEKRRMEHELKAAKRIQANLLPKELPDRERLDVVAFTSPSGAVGGDFYDYFVIDQTHVGLVIADACGNGVPAAMLISQIQAILRSGVADGRPIEHILTHLNTYLQSQAETGFFATLFYGIVDIDSGLLRYANAGHDFPILVRRNGQSETLASTGPALGVVPELVHKTESVELQEGDCLVLYTDGVTEATSAKGKPYGEAQLRDMAIRSRHRQPDEMLDFLRYDVERFSSAGPARDDMTMMIVKINRLSVGDSYAA
jgi:serine phosphatase RsbU (regulator of sigma subunit)/DNA-binding transcriptional regulator YhcF (GntR family)